jgi:feruloyl esterase
VSQIPPGAWVPPAKTAAIGAEVLRLCDSLDGLSDGIINNYLACDRLLDPDITPDPLKHIRCPNGDDTGNDCLSDKQMAVVNSFHATEHYGYALANGNSAWPGWGTGMEGTPAAGPFGAWLTTAPRPDPSDPGTFDGGPGGPLVKGRIGGGQDFNLLTFDVAKFKTQVQALSNDVDTRTDWSGFFKRNGRLIMISAGSDPVSNPRAQMMLYDEVVKRSGQSAVDRSVRYYVSPNVVHSLTGKSASGVAVPSSEDTFAYLRAWVEKGTPPPDPVIQYLLSKTSPSTVEASRPLCRYPKYPRYKGSGDVNVAESYVCTAP